MNSKLDVIASINCCCENIERDESSIHAFVEKCLDTDRIRQDSRQLFETHTNPEQRPTLFGTLLGVKDIIHVDGFPTRCGSGFPAQHLAGPEAPIVTQLKCAGMVIAGKTVTAEFAISDPGPTCNPVALSHTPGGSSSGSAAAVAAGFCHVALGSQTGGSVIRPAAYCGVIGFKPSFGRISTEGVFPYSKSLDHVGLFANDLPVIETVMAVIGQHWQTDFSDGVELIRAGLPKGPYLEIASDSALRHFYQTLQSLEGSNVNVQAYSVLEDIDDQNNALDNLGAAEAYRVHQSWFDEFRDVYKPLALKLLEQGRQISDPELEGLIVQARRKQFEMQQTMDKLGVDIWLAPSATDVAPAGLAYTGDHRMNSIWSYTGLPVVTIPIGCNQQNLPYGMQIVGRYNRDEALLQKAKRVQQIICTATG